jgi:phosphohistidine phosphatase
LIYLLRHGEAEDAAADDAARRLTEKGERQARDAGLALKALGVGIDACLASPKVRARETARIACDALGTGVEVEETEALRGGAFDALELVAGRGDVLLVGHEPDFSAEVGRLTGAKVSLKKGGIAVVDGSTLVALWRPKEIRRIAGSA